MLGRNNQRQFDGITGAPMYPIQNCEYPLTCSYPYCTCRVPHDKRDQPYQARAGVDWSVVGSWVLILTGLVIFWTALIVELGRLL